MTSANLEENDIEFRIIHNKDQDVVLDFLRTHYYLEEPLTIGSEPKQQDAEDEEFSISNINHGMCIMAVQKPNMKSGGKEKIAGVILAGPKDVGEADHLFEEAKRLGPTKWGRILLFLAFVEREANVYAQCGVTCALHGHVLAVDSTIRGKGIGARLIQTLKDVGRRKQFPVLTFDCTSLYSAQLCERLGMCCIYTLRYADYVDDNGKQVFHPPMPHNCVKTYATLL